jgi:hypothetical protein
VWLARDFVEHKPALLNAAMDMYAIYPLEEP